MMKLQIEIPKEFEESFELDNLIDSLLRLWADAHYHLLVGQYEKETVAMLIEAFRKAVKIRSADVEEMKHGEWISTKDRLPEKGQYLVAYYPCYWDNVDYSKICVGLDSYRAGKTEPTYKRWAKTKYQRVTHWMPLPDLPKDGT